MAASRRSTRSLPMMHPPRLGEIESLYSTKVGRCPARPRPEWVRRPDYSVGPRRKQFSSLDWGFGLDQLFCTQPRQLVVARSSAGGCRPATLLHVLALFPIRGDLLKGCQVRFCV